MGDDWPYLAMAVAFGGVSLGHLLQQRRLEELAEPLHNTMALLPIAVGTAIFGVESRADASIAFLLAGLVYAWQTLLKPSIRSARLALLFGNLSLWLFIGGYPDLSFMNHPPLWLIPPALSVLIATWWHRERFTSRQLRWAQSLSIAMIYLASTSEIFINGLGEQLWPPMILAVLAVGGNGRGDGIQVARVYWIKYGVFIVGGDCDGGERPAATGSRLAVVGVWYHAGDRHLGRLCHLGEETKSPTPTFSINRKRRKGIKCPNELFHEFESSPFYPQTYLNRIAFWFRIKRHVQCVVWSKG